MDNPELLDWVGVGWCFFWGVQATAMLMRYRKLPKMRQPPPFVLALTGFSIVCQVVGLACFTSAALWLQTVRELGLPS